MRLITQDLHDVKFGHLKVKTYVIVNNKAFGTIKIIFLIRF
jgi:hypothetical protein